MQPQSNPYPKIIETLTRHLKETRKAYYTGMPGVTYEDMAAAARRVLEMRAAYERASGRKVTTKVTAGAIANLLRMSL